MKEDGLTLSHQNKILPRTIFRRKWSIFFDTIKRYRGKTMEQLNFYKLKFHLRNHHSQIQHWSDDRWKACLAAGGGSKRRYQYCSDDSGKDSLPPCSSRTFWKQSHRSNVTGQCGDWDWNIPLRLPHWMSFQSSFYYQQWIDTWRSRFE